MSFTCSVASLWELANNLSLGKITLAFTLRQLVAELLKNNIQLLPVSADHAIKVKDLPFHHHDPFERLLVATASCDGFEIMSDDGFVQTNVRTRPGEVTLNMKGEM